MSGDTRTKIPQGTEENRNDEIVGMTLADYMSVPVVEHSKANSQGRGPSRTGEDSGRVNAPASGSGNSSRGGTASGVRGNPKFVPLAPAHIAPPSRPAPQWIVEMQVPGSTFCLPKSYL